MIPSSSYSFIFYLQFFLKELAFFNYLVSLCTEEAGWIHSFSLLVFRVMDWYPSNLQRWPRFIFCIIINSYIFNMLICVNWLWSLYLIFRLVGITSSWFLCSYAVNPGVFQSFLAFWYDNMSRSVCALPTPDLESAISQISPKYFYWETLEGSF